MSLSPAANRRGPRAALICALAILVLCIAFGAYAGSYSRADAAAAEAFAHAERSDGLFAFGDPAAVTGLILYPGGQVDEVAYAPLAKEIAETADVLCVVPSMPFHLAVFDTNAAARVMAQYPSVQTWFLGGHSLGGTMAASCAAAHPEQAHGVILLGAYAAEPLAVPALSIYGDCDTVLNMANYQAHRSNLPAGFTELVIPGGNHAQFGGYGAQNGDSEARITGSAQRRITAEAVRDFLHTISRTEELAA